MTTEETQAQYELLSGQSLFTGVSLDAVEGFFEAMVEQSFAPQTMIIEPKHRNHHLYLILEGAVRVYFRGEDEEPYHTLGPGECFGEMSLMDEGQVSASVVAVGTCKCLLIHEDVLWAMVDTSHGISRNLLKILSRRLRVDNEIIVSNREQLKRWEYYSLADSLTGMNNRRWVEETLPLIVKRAQMDNKPLTVMFVDVDQFRLFNEKYGHLAGDHALRSVSQSLRISLRTTDLMARFGGEEFLIFLNDTRLEQGVEIANRLRDTAAKTPVTDELPPIKVSVGLSELEEGDEGLDLLSRAEQAMYVAKQSGRNCVKTLVSH